MGPTHSPAEDREPGDGDEGWQPEAGTSPSPTWSTVTCAGARCPAAGHRRDAQPIEAPRSAPSAAAKAASGDPAGRRAQSRRRQPPGPRAEDAVAGGRGPQAPQGHAERVSRPAVCFVRPTPFRTGTGRAAPALSLTVWQKHAGGSPRPRRGGLGGALEPVGDDAPPARADGRVAAQSRSRMRRPRGAHRARHQSARPHRRWRSRDRRDAAHADRTGKAQGSQL